MATGKTLLEMVRDPRYSTLARLTTNAVLLEKEIEEKTEELKHIKDKINWEEYRLRSLGLL